MSVIEQEVRIKVSTWNSKRPSRKTRTSSDARRAGFLPFHRCLGRRDGSRARPAGCGGDSAVLRHGRHAVRPRFRPELDEARRQWPGRASVARLVRRGPGRPGACRTWWSGSTPSRRRSTSASPTTPAARSPRRRAGGPKQLINRLESGWYYQNAERSVGCGSRPHHVVPVILGALWGPVRTSGSGARRPGRTFAVEVWLSPDDPLFCGAGGSTAARSAYQGRHQRRRRQGYGAALGHGRCLGNRCSGRRRRLTMLRSPGPPAVKRHSASSSTMDGAAAGRPWISSPFAADPGEGDGDRLVRIVPAERPAALRHGIVVRVR